MNTWFIFPTHYCDDKYHVDSETQNFFALFCTPLHQLGHPHSYAHTHTLSRTHMHTFTHAHTHTHSHMHTLTHPHTYTRSRMRTHTHTCTYKCTLETTNRWLIFSDSLSTTNFILTRKKFSIAKTMKISNVRGYIFQTVSNLHILHIPNTTIFRTTSKHFPCEKNNEHIRFSRVHFPKHVKCQHLAFSKHSNLQNHL